MRFEKMWSAVCLAAVLIVASAIFTDEASAKQFSDVKKNHYAYKAIQWAQKEGIVDGYSDGKFGPNNKVTEAQFAKMLVQYYELRPAVGSLNVKENESLWSEPYYVTLAAHGAPLNGYFEKSVRNAPVERGLVAHSMEYLYGGYTNIYQAISDFIHSDISTGQNAKYKDIDDLKYFGYKNTLTRAQAVTFFYRLEEMYQYHKEDYESRYNDEYSKVNYIPILAYEESSKTSLVEAANQAISTIHRDLRKGQNKYAQQLPDAFLTYHYGQGIVGGSYFPVNSKPASYVSEYEGTFSEYSDTVYVKVGQRLKIMPAEVLIGKYNHSFISLDEQNIEDILNEDLVITGAGEFAAIIKPKDGIGDTLYIRIVSEK